MSSVKIHVIGRLGADAEVKQTKQGKDFATFNLAVDDFAGGKKITSWFAVADFSDVAKRRAEYLKKGSMIEVQGLETCRIYMDRNNLPQIARDIRATHIDFIPTSSRNNSDENIDCGTLTTPQQTETQQVATHVGVVREPAVVTTSTSSEFEDDLPF